MAHRTKPKKPDHMTRAQAIEYIKEYLQYDYSEAFEIALNDMEFREPMPWIRVKGQDRQWSACSKCLTVIDIEQYFCPSCGQLIDWGKCRNETDKELPQLRLGKNE